MAAAPNAVLTFESRRFWLTGSIVKCLEGPYAEGQRVGLVDGHNWNAHVRPMLPTFRYFNDYKLLEGNSTAGFAAAPIRSRTRTFAGYSFSARA